MNSKEFVACWKREKEQLLLAFTAVDAESRVRARIDSMHLTADQINVMQSIVDGILTDTFYTLLLGLDGAASIGGVQQQYRIHDQDGAVISSPGDLEEEAWLQFQSEDA